MAYRTSVLYDFSTVSKAKFYVFEEDVVLTDEIGRASCRERV